MRAWWVSRRFLGIAIGVVLVVGAVVAPARASFSSAASFSAQEVTTGTLAAPTNLTASNQNCLLAISTEVKLSWTATTSSFADGYQIFRSTTNGGPYSSIGTVTGVSTTSFVDKNVQFSTTYYYVVKSKKHLWRSPNSNQATIKTPGSTCLL